MSARRIVAAGVATVALFATGVVTWLEVGVEERWPGGEPGVVLARREVAENPTPTPTPTPSPGTTAEPTGPTAVFPRPYVPAEGSREEPRPSSARSNAPDHSGGGEGAPGRDDR